MNLQNSEVISTIDSEIRQLFGVVNQIEDMLCPKLVENAEETPRSMETLLSIRNDLSELANRLFAIKDKLTIIK